MNKKTYIIIFIVVIVLLGVFAWYVGMFDKKDVVSIIETKTPTTENIATTTIEISDPEPIVVVKPIVPVQENKPATLMSILPLLMLLLEALQELAVDLIDFRDNYLPTIK